MDDVTDAYGGHHYINNHDPADLDFYRWFLEEVRDGVRVAVEKDKPFTVGEFGPRQHRGSRYGYRRWDGCYYRNRPSEPLVSLQISEAIIAMINAGVHGMCYWTFADFPDDYRENYANKWGTFRWSGKDHSTRAHYYALGLLTKFFRGPADACRVKTDDQMLRAAAVRHRPAGTWSVAVVNRHEKGLPVRLQLAGSASPTAF